MHCEKVIYEVTMELNDCEILAVRVISQESVYDVMMG